MGESQEKRKEKKNELKRREILKKHVLEKSKQILSHSTRREFMEWGIPKMSFELYSAPHKTGELLPASPHYSCLICTLLPAGKESGKAGCERT